MTMKKQSFGVVNWTKALLVGLLWCNITVLLCSTGTWAYPTANVFRREPYFSRNMRPKTIHHVIKLDRSGSSPISKEKNDKQTLLQQTKSNYQFFINKGISNSNDSVTNGSNHVQHNGTQQPKANGVRQPIVNGTSIKPNTISNSGGNRLSTKLNGMLKPTVNGDSETKSESTAPKKESNASKISTVNSSAKVNGDSATIHNPTNKQSSKPFKANGTQGLNLKPKKVTSQNGKTQTRARPSSNSVLFDDGTSTQQQKKKKRSIANRFNLIRIWKHRRKNVDQVVPPQEEMVVTPRKSWKRRHARSAEDGIRREKSTKLSSLLKKANVDFQKSQPGRRYTARLIMGLINALADEVIGLDVQIDSRSDTPIWGKHVDELRIFFSRLGFKPFRMGGADRYTPPKKQNLIDESPLSSSLSTSISDIDATTDAQVMQQQDQEEFDLALVDCPDEAFDRIDADKSGALDRDEIARALNMVASIRSNIPSIKGLATELVKLYDLNGDGVVDREEYQTMVEDMAAISRQNKEKELKIDTDDRWWTSLRNSVPFLSQSNEDDTAIIAAETEWETASSLTLPKEGNSVSSSQLFGSIVLTDLKLDLRRLMFGGIPVVKHITPGGPLILEPFTITVTGSFTREDVLGSFVLDAGLRRLVARALRVRVRSLRDFVDGAVFFGRRWKMTSKSAPVVEVLGLSNVEFDNKNRMIITGRAKVRTSPDVPIVTNTFKVRTKLGTRKDGQVIRLEKPELAFVFECPKGWERNVESLCNKLGVKPPKRPNPIYSFFPIYSPFKVDDNSGFDMGEDNCIKSIYIKDGALRFQMRSVLRPGRFLGNHYLAFTIPNRTCIITMDRVMEGIRAARKNKKVADRERKLADRQAKLDSGDALLTAADDETDRNSFLKRGREGIRSLFFKLSSRRKRRKAASKLRRRPPKSFFSRFVEGYTLSEPDVDSTISDWFGRQGNAAGSTRTNTTAVAV